MFQLKYMKRVIASIILVIAISQNISAQSKDAQAIRNSMNEQLAAWKQMLSADVPAFNALIQSTNVPALYVPPEG